jgi:DNA-binding response OmpR family regulator
MRKIWIVDDDSEMSHAMQLMLKLLDCEVTPFYTARSAAHALLAGQRPELIILDINMPEVSGLDMLEFVRRHTEWQHLPVVMLSTEAQDVTVDRALALGADGYMMKPVTIEELEKALKSAFQKHQKG